MLNNMVKLVGVPYPVPGMKARDLAPGSVLVWNGGSTSTVVSIVPSASGKSLTLTTRTADGRTWTRRTTPDRVFAVRN